MLSPIDMDWAAIGGWAGGIATVMTAIFLAVQRALTTARGISKDSPTTTSTNIITADTIAMDRLSGSIEGAVLMLREMRQDYVTLRQDSSAQNKAVVEAMHASVKATERACDTIDEARTDIRELGREIHKLVRDH